VSLFGVCWYSFLANVVFKKKWKPLGKRGINIQRTKIAQKINIGLTLHEISCEAIETRFGYPEEAMRKELRKENHQGLNEC